MRSIQKVQPLASAELANVRLGSRVVSVDRSAEYGRLEVFSRGGWNTICRDALRDGLLSGDDEPEYSPEPEAAEDVCRTLGYLQGRSVDAPVGC